MNAPTVGVASFPRAGSTLTMRMLHAGGIAPVAGTQPGSYELPDLTDIANASRAALAGRSIKLLDTFRYLPSLTTADRWKLIWLDRDPHEQAKSQHKFLSILMPDVLLEGRRSRDIEVIARAFRDDRLRALTQLRGAGPVLVMQFESILAKPHTATAALREFLAPELTFDDQAAAAVVIDRGPECQPGLAIETELSR